jgi:hypothetical protein
MLDYASGHEALLLRIRAGHDPRPVDSTTGDWYDTLGTHAVDR